MDISEYQLKEPWRVHTPALVVYPRIVDDNVRALLRLAGGDPNRLRPHVKTAKLASVVQCYLSYGVRQFKCATTRELEMLCACGADDVLVAFPCVGARAERVREIAAAHPGVRVSALVDCREHIEPLRGGAVSAFVDVNPGMDRTGANDADAPGIVALARAAAAAGIGFRGLHHYDGQLSYVPFTERCAAARPRYERLMRVVAALDGAGLAPGEVVTSGSPTLTCAMSFSAFASGPFTHRVSPGTAVLMDAISLERWPSELGLRPAAVVVSTVVSRPLAQRFTSDAGFKAIINDAGSPTCMVLGLPGATRLASSEEHLSVDLPAGAPMPEIGSAVYLLPRRIGQTVNLHDEVVLAEDGAVLGVEPVRARGYESPLPQVQRHEN